MPDTTRWLESLLLNGKPFRKEATNWRSRVQIARIMPGFSVELTGTGTDNFASSDGQIHNSGRLHRPEATIEYDLARSHRYRLRREVEIEGWFDDAATLQVKLQAIREAGGRKVGFWRLGQEDPRIWPLVEAAEN